MSLKRQWDVILGSDEYFTVMTFNCLADGLAQNAGFDVKDKRILEWKYRKHVLASVIATSGADVVCLQEVNHFDELADLLNPVYSKSYFTQKFNSTCRKYNAPPDGCAIFIKNGFECEIVEFFESPYNTYKSQVYQRLTFKWHNQDIVLYNTHLKAKKIFDQIRLEQLTELNQDMKRMANVYGENVSFMLVGDLNMEPAVGRAWRYIRTFMDDAHAHVNTPFFFTTWKRKENSTDEMRISDYIFTSNLFVCATLTPFPTAKLPACRFPCSWCPSDHIPMMARIMKLEKEPF